MALELDPPLTASLHEPDEDRPSLIAILWRGRWWCVACVLTCLALASVYLVGATRAYQATTRLLILRQGGRPLDIGHGGTNRPAEEADDYIPTQAMIVGSPVVVGRAIQSIGLENLPSLADPRRTGPGAVQRAIKNLAITRPDRLARVLQLEYRAKSPGEAVRMLRAITESYQAFLEGVYQKNNSEVVVLITKARDDLNAELEDLERRYLEFRREHPVATGVGSERPLISRRVDEWDRASNEVMVKAVQLKEQLELGQGLAREGIGLWAIAHAMDQLDAASTSGLDARTQGLLPGPPSDYLRQLAQEQQRLAERYGPQSTRVREIQEQIEQAQGRSRDVRSQFEQDEIRDLLESIEASLASIERMRAEIAHRFEGDLALAREAEIDVLTESNLRSNLERQRTLFHAVVDQLKEAEFTGDFGTIRSEVIAPANALPKPVRPLVSLTLALALVVGCALGTAAAVASDLLDSRLRSPADVRRSLRLPLLGQVPQLPALQARRAGPVGLISHALPQSSLAEAYKVARASLEIARRNRRIRVILVTGPHAAAGTTTVASNLAICLAQAGRKVLLVDADLRRPELHEVHGLRRELGLVQVLRGLMPAGRVVQPTPIRNLDVITSGPPVSNPAELLSSPWLNEFLATVRAGYDAVIIDSPPLLTVADPSILGAAADGIVLVVQIAATRRDAARRALEILKGLGSPILGTLLNGVGADASHGADPEPARAPDDRQVIGVDGPEDGLVRGDWLARVPQDGHDDARVRADEFAHADHRLRLLEPEPGQTVVMLGLPHVHHGPHPRPSQRAELNGVPPPLKSQEVTRDEREAR